MLTFEFQNGMDDEAVFYLYVDQAPSMIKFAFSVTSADATPVDVIVRRNID